MGHRRILVVVLSAVAVAVVLLGALVDVTSYRTGASSPRTAATEFLRAASRGDCRGASRLTDSVSVNAEDLERTREWWFGSAETMPVEDVELEESRAGGESGDIRFTLVSYATDGVVHSGPPKGDVSPNVVVRLEEGTWRVCGF